MIRINLLGKVKKKGPFGIDVEEILAKLGYKGSIDDILAYKGQAIKVAVAFMGVYVASLVPTMWLETEMAKTEKESQKYQTQIDALEKELAGKKQVRNQMTKLQSEEDEIKRQLQIIGSLASNRSLVFKAIERVSGLIPENAWIDTLDLGDTSIRLQGSAWDFSNINDFVRGLTENVQFSNIHLQGITTTDIPNPVAGIPKYLQKVKNYTIEFNWRNRAGG